MTREQVWLTVYVAAIRSTADRHTHTSACELADLALAEFDNKFRQ